MSTFGPDEFSLADGTTGRYLVLFAESAVKEGTKALREDAGIAVSTASGKETDTDSLTALEDEGGVVFDHLGCAVVSAPPDQIEEASISAAGDSAILAVEPERIVHAIEVVDYPVAALPVNGAPTIPTLLPAPPTDAVSDHSTDYLRGYRDAVLHLTSPAAAPASLAAGQALALPAAVDESQATWGLQATRVVNSCRTGRGIRVAVLDTGFDLNHPDFAQRTIKSQSFVFGEAVQDLHGHGTHCIGTAMGPKCAATRPRYGVAYESEIYAGKVLSNRGSGTDSQILAGINWAVANKCAVISMSLGAPTRAGQSFSQVFEIVALRAAQAGSMIVAAAGNDSRRPIVISPVSHPANCPSIMAVAALDVNTGIASFSNRGINPSGGQIDVAGPGVDVYSSWPMPTRYRRISGTSMATPHAAGVAALLAEANPVVRGAALGRLLIGTARRLATLPSADVGAGLVQAP